MRSDDHLCENCPEAERELRLTETRFQHGHCYIELECEICARCWTAEVAMPSEDLCSRAALRCDGARPTWSILDIWRRAA